MLHWALRLRGPGTAIQTVVTVRHNVYSFGGDGNRRIDVHIFNTVSLTWRKLTPVTPERERQLVVPSNLINYTAVLIGDSVYIWGSSIIKGKYYKGLYAFDIDVHTWSIPQVSGAVPEAMGTSSACVLGKVMLIHGGLNYSKQTNNTYKLDTSTMVCTLINTRGTLPAATSGHSAIIIGTKMFVFGGFSNGSHNTSIKVFDTENELWMTTPSTEPHPEGCRYSVFAYNGELYMFVGVYIFRVFRDLWKLNPETFSWKKVEPKGLRPWQMENCCCITGDRVILIIPDGLSILDLSPSLKTLCKLAVIQYDLEKSDLPHNIRWELEAITTNSI